MKSLQGINLIVSLLSFNEKPEPMFNECENLGVKYLHMGLPGSNLSVLSDENILE